MRREDKLAALHASIAVLWAITTAPDVVQTMHSSVDDLVGDVARHVAATTSNAYTHVCAQLAVASSAFAACRCHYSPANIFARLVVASSATLAVTLDLIELEACYATRCYLESLAGWLRSQPGGPTS